MWMGGANRFGRRASKLLAPPWHRGDGRLVAAVGGSEGVDGADDAFALLQGSPVTACEAAETFPGGFGAVVGAVDG